MLLFYGNNVRQYLLDLNKHQLKYTLTVAWHSTYINIPVEVLMTPQH
jgi:hypothetical protein